MKETNKRNFPCECNLTQAQDATIGMHINRIIRTNKVLCIPIGLPRLRGNSVSMDFRIKSKRIVEIFNINC